MKKKTVLIIGAQSDIIKSKAKNLLKIIMLIIKFIP